MGSDRRLPQLTAHNHNQGADPMTAAQFCRLAARYRDLDPTTRRAVDALAIGDARTADDHAPRGTDSRRTADRYLIDLDAAGAPVGPARPAPDRFVPMFAD